MLKPVQRPPEYYEKKFPARVWRDNKLVFFWQTAYPDAHDYHYVLPGNIWDELSYYKCRANSNLHKEYDSADVAINDLLRILERLHGGVL